MKTFVKENWYKLMVGSSMLMASFGFMIYAISPAYSNSDKTEIKNTNAPLGSNGVIVDGNAYFVDGGYIYQFRAEYCNYFIDNPTGSFKPKKIKLP
jgi:hypothetical protein